MKPRTKKIKELAWFDILILTLIMFGQAIWTSQIQFLQLQSGNLTLDDTVTFSSMQNIQAIGSQGLLLIIAFIYILVRNVDLRIFTDQIKWTKWVPLQMLAFFVLPSLLMDIYAYLSFYATAPMTPSVFNILSDVDSTLIFYSLLNGFYEEIFFLGICLAVKAEHYRWVIPFSLLVRISFHTYQGLGGAIALGLILGILYLLFYRKMKTKNLLPFFLAHAIADIVGLSVLHFFF